MKDTERDNKRNIHVILTQPVITESDSTFDYDAAFVSI